MAEPFTASEAEWAFARQVLAATPHELLYARVDIAPDGHGGWRLMELEVTEPNLFLHQGGAAAVQRLVETLLSRL